MGLFISFVYFYFIDIIDHLAPWTMFICFDGERPSKSLHVADTCKNVILFKTFLSMITSLHNLSKFGINEMGRLCLHKKDKIWASVVHFQTTMLTKLLFLTILTVDHRCFWWTSIAHHTVKNTFWYVLSYFGSFQNTKQAKVYLICLYHIVFCKFYFLVHVWEGCVYQWKYILLKYHSKNNKPHQVNLFLQFGLKENLWIH